MAKLMCRFAIWLLASMWRYGSRKELLFIKRLGQVGNSKEKMVALIKELHSKNDGSYKSSNAIILFNIPCGKIKVQHVNGYVTVTYIANNGFKYKRYIMQKVEFDDDIVDFKKEAAEKLFPNLAGKFWDDFDDY